MGRRKNVLALVVIKSAYANLAAIKSTFGHLAAIKSVSPHSD